MHVAQVMDDVVLHVSFVHVSIHVAMNMFGMCMLHYMLMMFFKKNLKCRSNICSVQHLLSRKRWVGGSSQNCGCIV